MEAQAGTDTEIEWQFDAQDLRVVLRWIEDVAAGDGAGGVAIDPPRTRNHVDTYFDTEDRRLDRAGYSFRVRRSRRLPTEATLKSVERARPDALRIRRELAETVGPDEPATLTHLGGPVGERVRALVGSRSPASLFDVQTQRRSYPLRAASAPSGELSLDKTTIREPGGRILGRLQRVEVEVPAAALADVEPLVERLQRACGLQPAVLSKYETALVAAGTDRAAPESFGPTSVDPGDTIGQVGLAVLRRQFAILRTKEPGTRLGDDIEELHDMRVASRRLRAALALFGDALPAEAARLRPELAWVGRTIGDVRDLDVQLAQLAEHAEALPAADREPLERLRALLTEERAQARTEMLQALDSPRYERLVRRFAAMLRSRSGVRTSPARAVAPELVAHRRRAVRKAMRRVGPEQEAAAYHRLRIAGKRFRYALEFLSDVYPGDTAKLVRRVVALQDLLGDYQDAVVGIARLRELAEGRNGDLGTAAAFAMGEIAERYRADMDEIRGQVPATYARISGKPWKRLEKRMQAARPPMAAPLPSS